MSVKKEKKYTEKEARVRELREIISSLDINKLLHGLPEREFREQRIIRAREIIRTHAVERVKIFDGYMNSLIKATRKSKDVGTIGLIIEDMMNFATGIADEMDLTEPGSFEDTWRHIRAEWKLALSVVLIAFAIAFFIVKYYYLAFFVILLLLLVVRLEFLKKLIFSGGKSRIEALMGDEE